MVSQASRTALLMLLFGLAACNPRIKFVDQGGFGSFYPYQGEVVVLTRLPEKQAYKRIGTLSAESHVVKIQSDATIMRDMKAKAAEFGANAIVLHDGRITQGEIDNRVNLKWYRQYLEPFNTPGVTTATAIYIYPQELSETEFKQELHINYK